MARMLYCVGVLGLLSTLHLAKIMLSPYVSSNSWIAGPIALHGPHQGAQKSTKAGFAASNISD
jgi:hypothetical protein